MNLYHRLIRMADWYSVATDEEQRGATSLPTTASQIQKDLLEIIGANEVGNIGYDGDEMRDDTTEEMMYRNQLRAELRTKILTYTEASNE